MKACHYMFKQTRAFTLMEVMVVVAIMIAMAAFAIPDYSNSVNRARIKDAISQLEVLNAANALYYAQNNAYYPGSGLTIDQINTGLNINLIANGLTYSYTRSSTTAYTATATYGTTFSLRVSQDSVYRADSSSNPCCNTPGTCYSLVFDC